MAVKSVMALGMFDGMHPGHLAVIDRAVKEARDNNMRAVVYTFVENPRALFAQAPLQLMTPEARRAAMLARGVDGVEMVRFTKALASMPPPDFARMLAREYALGAVVVGEDYTFGAGARGDARTLAELGKELAFRVIVIPAVRSVTETGAAGEKVSSSRIRQAILENRPEDAYALLHGKPVKTRDEWRCEHG